MKNAQPVMKKSFSLWKVRINENRKTQKHRGRVEGEKISSHNFHKNLV
jgi:hypothetical protein